MQAEQHCPPGPRSALTDRRREASQDTSASCAMQFLPCSRRCAPFHMSSLVRASESGGGRPRHRHPRPHAAAEVAAEVEAAAEVAVVAAEAEVAEEVVAVAAATRSSP